ncbi:MAG: TonB-dependent receptor [Bacteroidales bacterium]|nr:TonB-dependent receptor [Bacteroidales bacterium]MDD3960352.1 TonB-dependent receptor [Bacteroidales bacterium]MDY0284960.1 TonB-dependent receptor [Bacteroidales bacterium]HPE86612.1 TonB-dependent receptor [Bacteroidales bacterium]
MKKNLLYLITFFLLLFIVSGAMAQKGTIRGFVYEASTGEPAIFVNVYLYKTTFGAATDINGYFVIDKIPAGAYDLMVTSIGYDSLVMPVTVQADKIQSINLNLNESAYQIKGVNISASRQEAKTETNTSVVKITPKQIDKIPAVGGQKDFAQYLQVLPGVVFTGDQGGQLYIRGGSPIQNKVILDGMVIYNPFHSIGLFSVFDSDLMINADVYTGGFGAEYGGRISSVMDIRTRDGNKTHLGGKFDVSTFGAKILLEGPLKKKFENSGSSSFVLSAKTSYLNQSAQTLYTYIPDGLPYTYRDLYGKVSLNAANGSKLNLFGFNFNDAVNGYKGLADYSWGSFGGGSNFVVIPGNTPTLLEGNFAYSRYDISMQEGELKPRTSAIDGFNLGMTFTYFIGKDEIKYGVEMLGFNTNFRFYNGLGLKIEQDEHTTELGLFIKYKGMYKNWIIEPSFRLQYYASLGNTSPEPRLAVKYNATDRLRFKLASGIYSQNFISATSDRDVVNLFYGFLSGPDNLPETFLGEDLTHKLQKANHLIIGMEYDLTYTLTLNVEGYYKDFTQLTNLNRNKVYDDIQQNYDKPDYLKKDFIIEKGDAYGVDFTLKYDYKRIYLWMVYSHGYVTRTDEILKYYPHYDRRHNVNLLGTYTTGQDLSWEFSARWNFGSGFPFTLTQGFYEQILFTNGIFENYLTTNGDLAVIYADLNTGRLPYYHRFDVTIKKSWEIGRTTKIEATAGVTNVYNRENIFYIDRITNDRINQLPILPSAGINIAF